MYNTIFLIMSEIDAKNEKNEKNQINIQYKNDDTNTYPKVCVIMPTYFRKDGTTKELLSRALRMLEGQSYKNFKLFLIGDHYDDNNEFEELCKSYKKDIFYTNNQNHYRCYNFPNKNTYWAIGGALALKTGIEKAIEEKFDYYFHLDDDDEWRDIHIQVVVDHIKHFPLSDFILTKAKYKTGFLPRTNEKNIFYNNYIPKGEDSVHASHIYKLSVLGDVILNIINMNHILANKINNKEDVNIYIPPGDATILNHINNMVLNKKIKSLYIPIITVNKISDCNFPV